jgi:hypothetical protein
LAYGGDEYLIHYKYADKLNVICIALMYGFGQPLQFPIAAFNLLNQYMCERFTVAYYMKLPPILDNRLMKSGLMILQLAPILFLMQAFWMVGQPQIFGADSWNYIDN